MQAARYHDYGDPDVLLVEDAPEPHAGPNSVRISVQAVSVNPIDFLLRAGQLQHILPLPLPAIPGRDAVGVVDEVGPGVANTQVGDLVFGLGGISDTTAQFAVLTAWSSVPSGWTTEQAAAAGLASATAAEVLAVLGDLEGKTLLVEGASGAVGTAVVAFALAAGVRVIGTARQANHDHLIAMGAEVTTYGDGLAERVAKLAPTGVDAAAHVAPSASLPELVAIVQDPQRVVTVVDTEGAARLGTRTANAVNDSSLLEQAAELGERGLYHPRVDQVLPLASIVEAHTRAQHGGGKIVITVS